MRIALLSDIHANLEALEAVLAHVETQRCEEFVCLGDFVGYGPDPNECIERLRGRLRAAVVGNHDLAAIGARSAENFNPWAFQAILWTQRALTEGARAFLSALPERADLEAGDAERALLVHGSPRDPVDEYVFTTRDARSSFVAHPFRLAFVGHTHQPVIFEEERHRVRVAEWLPEIPRPVRPPNRYLINVGSIGQPRDGDPRAAYVVYETNGPSVTLHRLEYAVEETQKKMHAAGLPEALIERLALGR